MELSPSTKNRQHCLISWYSQFGFKLFLSFLWRLACRLAWTMPVTLITASNSVFHPTSAALIIGRRGRRSIYPDRQITLLGVGYWTIRWPWLQIWLLKIMTMNRFRGHQRDTLQATMGPGKYYVGAVSQVISAADGMVCGCSVPP